MRLRQSNKQKQFSGLPDYGLDISDAENTSLRVDSSEDEFVVDGAATGKEAKQVADHAQSVHDEDDGNGSHGDDGDIDGPARHRIPSAAKATKTAKSKSKTKPSGRLKPEQSDDNTEQVFTEVPPYPSDPGQRWTRTYIGPIKRWTRFYELIDWWFGDQPDRRDILDGYLRLWWEHELIPPKLISQPRLLIAQSGWMSKNFVPDQRSKYRQLYSSRLVHQLRQQTSTPIDKSNAFRWFLPRAQGELTVLLGPVSDQKPYPLRQGESISLSDTGTPISDADNNQEQKSGGWLLDVGGIPVSIAWAPTQGQVDQLLAIAVAPFSDQAYYPDLKDAPKESDQKQGSVQIIRFEAVEDQRGILRPSRRAPRLAQALCFAWGRVSRIQWCPIPLLAEDTTRLLAVLCVDGKIRIIGVQNVSEQDKNDMFEEIVEPMVLLEPPKEYSIEITCFTWINMNRIAAGLSDGSVLVFSLSPPRVLQRHPVHSTAIVDIVSGYPTDPFIVSTVPIGGVLTITDLRRPSAETTYHPNMMVSLQPNLLAWTPHLRGYAAMWPSAFAGNPNLTFLPARGFPLCRHLLTVSGLPTCVNIGACHPYILTGTTDGTVWVFNILRKLSSHREKTLKVKLFHHEYSAPRPADTKSDGNEESTSRGMSRILHGFLPEPNTHPTGVKMAETQRQNRQNNVKGKSKGKATGKNVKSASKAPSQTEVEVDEEAAMTTGPGPIVLYEPYTRITAAVWNPNVEFSWWAAAAMASGLVRVMDVGAEPRGEGQDFDEDEDPGGANGGYSMDVMGAEEEEREGEGDEDEDVEMASWEE